jgi:hypothetical protein
MDKCTKCQRIIEMRETPCVFKGKVVCLRCDGLLRGTGKVVPVTPPVPVQKPVVIDTPKRRRISGFGIAALALGILACLTCLIPFLGILVIPMAGIGLILGIIGIIAAVVTKKTHASMPIAGSVVCALAIGLAIFMTGAMATANDAQQARVVQHPAPLEDKWAGFQGLRWGTSIASVPGMSLFQEDGYEKSYRWEGDSLSIGKAELTRIIYGFYKGRLYSVIAQSDGLLNWDALREAVFATYGEGRRQDPSISKWGWGRSLGLPGDEKVVMVLTYNESSKEASLMLWYVPLSDEKLADEAKAAR